MGGDTALVDFFGVFAGDLTRFAGDLTRFAGDLALEGVLDLAGVFFLALVAAFLVGDLALDGDLDLDLAGVLCMEERAESVSKSVDPNGARARGDDHSRWTIRWAEAVVRGRWRGGEGLTSLGSWRGSSLARPPFGLL